jgi:hypothetical protein
MSSDPNRYPPGWDAARVSAVLGHYERQTEDEAADEDAGAAADPAETVMTVPTDLVPAVRELIARRRPA